MCVPSVPAGTGRFRRYTHRVNSDPRPEEDIVSKRQTTEAPGFFIPYLRVSDVGGRNGDSYISKPVQLKHIRRTAAQHDLPLYPDLVLVDEDVSGGHMQREALQRGLDLIRTGQAAGFVVKDIQRYSRDTATGLQVLTEIEAAGGQLYSDRGRHSLRTGDEAFMTTIELAMGTRERANLRTGLLDSVETAVVDRGVHLSAPFGYRKDEETKKLVPEPREARLVKRMFQLRADGWTWPKIAAELNEGDVMPRPYKRHGIERQSSWTFKTVRQIVLSEVYLGTAFNGEHRHPGAHKALVDVKLWEKANRAKGTAPAKTEDGYLLSGLVRCATCGYVMINNAHRSSGKRYYRCRRGTPANGSVCDHQAVANADDLEALVEAEVKRWYEGARVKLVPSDADLELARAERDAKANAVRALVRELREQGEASEAVRAIFREELGEAEHDLAEAEAELQRVEALNEQGTPELPADFGRWDKLSIPRKRHLLSLWLACVVIRPSARWREPIAERAYFVGRDEAPVQNTRLLAWVAGRDW
jgi:DNA invertase Pin-like site-specific DNA recombinase